MGGEGGQALWKEQDGKAREAYEEMAELDRLRLRGGGARSLSCVSIVTWRIGTWGIGT